MTGRISTHVKGRQLQAYAAKLIDAGFRLYVPRPRLTVQGAVIPVSWLVYEKDGNVGMVEQKMDGYEHLMPVHPTRQEGSSILLFGGTWELHLGHAEKTARPENRGKYNGNLLFKNEGMTRFGDYVPVLKDEPRLVPVKVVWQEIRQYSTVLELEVTAGQLGSKAGRNKLREAIDDKLNEVDLESDELMDESWGGPHRHIDRMDPIWDAVEPKQEV